MEGWRRGFDDPDRVSGAGRPAGDTYAGGGEAIGKTWPRFARVGGVTGGRAEKGLESRCSWSMQTNAPVALCLDPVGVPRMIQGPR